MADQRLPFIFYHHWHWEIWKSVNCSTSNLSVNRISHTEMEATDVLIIVTDVVTGSVTLPRPSNVPWACVNLICIPYCLLIDRIYRERHAGVFIIMVCGQVLIHITVTPCTDSLAEILPHDSLARMYYLAIHIVHSKVRQQTLSQHR